MAGSLFNEPTTNTAAINTAVVIDFSAMQVSGRAGRRVVKHVGWSLDRDPTQPVPLTLESPPGSKIYEVDIVYGGKDYIEFPNNGIPGALGEILRVKIDPSSSNTVATLSVLEGSG